MQIQIELEETNKSNTVGISPTLKITPRRDITPLLEKCKKI